ncbi:MAG: hypothetical protein P4L84_35925 [Isosphaeraceae bacterium]|nr:hypothetical protein [Isosphaeraceae bacterium]
MSDYVLSRHIASRIEELIRMDSDEAAALASVLLASLAALRDGELTELSFAAWEFVDRHAPPPRRRLDEYAKHGENLAP